MTSGTRMLMTSRDELKQEQVLAARPIPRLRCGALEARAVAKGLYQ
jgi:hypothetical protein